MCSAAQRCALFWHLNLPRMVRTWCALYILTCKICFAPQRRALFQHIIFQKWSEHGVLCTFSLANVLRATMACTLLPKVVRTRQIFYTFSTWHLPKMGRSWCALYILTSNRASRHNGVQFFISHLASWLRTRGFKL